MVVPIGGSHAQALRAVSAANRGGDAIELRLDLLPGKSVAELTRKARKPVIATCRKKSEGGRFAGSTAKKLERLQEAIDLGARFVDAEFSSKRLLKKVKNAKPIVSHHNLRGTPDAKKIVALGRRMHAAAPDALVKIVCATRKPEDNSVAAQALLELREQGIPATVFCAGAKGRPSRVAAFRLGAELNFVSVGGMRTDSGQMEATALKKAVAAAVLGRPVRHSLSPAMHNAAFEACGMDGAFIALEPGDFGKTVRRLQGNGFAGLAVTMPFKEQALKLANVVSTQTREIGAVNTLVFRKGKVMGHNTDFLAALEIAKKLGLAGKKVLLLGAGGAAKAFGVALRKVGATATVCNWTAKNGETLARKTGGAFVSLGDLKKLDCSEFDCVVNASSIGMQGVPRKSVLTKKQLADMDSVVELVYAPEQTKLVKEARERGLNVVTGKEFLLLQGAKQFELFTGKKAPVEAMREALA